MKYDNAEYAKAIGKLMTMSDADLKAVAVELAKARPKLFNQITNPAVTEFRGFKVPYNAVMKAREYMMAEQKVYAVKEVRVASGMGLKDAVDFVQTQI